MHTQRIGQMVCVLCVARNNFAWKQKLLVNFHFPIILNWKWKDGILISILIAHELHMLK